MLKEYVIEPSISKVLRDILIIEEVDKVSSEALIQSNIQKSLEFIEATYMEPITVEYIEELFNILVKGFELNGQQSVEGGFKVLEPFNLGGYRVSNEDIRDLVNVCRDYQVRARKGFNVEAISWLFYRFIIPYRVFPFGYKSLIYLLMQKEFSRFNLDVCKEDNITDRDFKEALFNVELKKSHEPIVSLISKGCSNEYTPGGNFFDGVRVKSR